MWARALHRIEGAPTDERWPAPTFAADFAHGVELYRANVRSRMLHPEARHTDVPVQLVIPLRDRYVTPSLLDGLEEWTSRLWRRPVDAGHWVIRTNPDIIATAVDEVVAYVDQGVESPTLRSRHRLAALTSNRRPRRRSLPAAIRRYPRVKTCAYHAIPGVHDCRSPS